jgi:hypothetical protein
VQLGGRRQAAVLVALVFGHGRVVSVDALAVVVWPDWVQMSLDGAFDQEIAQALFITTPTVRPTLDAVRRRYQLTSASELANLPAVR